jgi:hypothetical protein
MGKSSGSDWRKTMRKAIKTGKRSEIKKPVSSNKIKIEYITLGSILDTALSVLGNNVGRLQEVRTIVTDFQYIDPRTGEDKKINLADIPISLKLFQTWFYDECVATERKTWKVKSFIKSLVDKLFLAAISERCFPSVGRSRRPRLNISLLQMPLTGAGECYITGKDSVEAANKTPRGKVKKIEELLKPGERKETSDDKVGQYMIFHLTAMSRSLAASNREDQAKENEKNGIPSLYIGSSRGLVKSISFRKEDSPEIAAFRITENEAQLGGMREIYNASVEMLGNNFFKPGSYVWIDASDSFFGSRINTEDSNSPSVGQQIGLGGFYMILSVNSKILAGEFSTSLDCRWQSDGLPPKE